jgi:hypothetical protein
MLFLLDGGSRIGRKKKKEREITIGEEGFPGGVDPPCWLCLKLQLLGAIKGLFEGQSLNFFSAPNGSDYFA